MIGHVRFADVKRRKERDVMMPIAKNNFQEMPEYSFV